jgi:hypothetical protein
MSILKINSEYIAACDRCGSILPSEYDFYDSVKAKKDAGWKSRKDRDGEWEDVCTDCQEQERI